jgi:hypothetical protein
MQHLYQLDFKNTLSFRRRKNLFYSTAADFSFVEMTRLKYSFNVYLVLVHKINAAHENERHH